MFLKFTDNLSKKSCHFEDNSRTLPSSNDCSGDFSSAIVTVLYGHYSLARNDSEFNYSSLFTLSALYAGDTTLRHFSISASASSLALV